MEKESEIFREYVGIGPNDLRHKMSGLKEEMIKKMVEAKVLDKFRIASTRVPAYKHFLKKHKINPKKITTLGDFKKLPLTNKSNYLMAYPIKDQVLDGDLSKVTSITASSGSSGKSFYWPRSLEQDMGIIQPIEAAFIENFEIDKKKTLHLTALGMGVWTGGDMVSMAARAIAQKGYDFATISTGLDVETNLKIIQDFGDYFDQIIITVYPSFGKDLVDRGEEIGIDWKKTKVKFFFGGEPFAEEWRNYVFKKISGTCIYKDIFSCFGSSEGGIAGVESPLCILVRQKCLANPDLAKRIFGDNRIPSVVQYNPLSKYFEDVNGELVLTSLNGLPLIRYNTKDAGSTSYMSEFLQILKENGIDAERELKKAGCSNYWDLPITYLFGRSDMTATIYGVNVYPENIRASLFHKTIRNFTTGKFFLKTIHDHEGNQILEISLELQKNIRKSAGFLKEIQKAIVTYLRENNGEYGKLYESIGAKVTPKIVTMEFGNEEFITENKLKFVKD